MSHINEYKETHTNRKIRKYYSDICITFPENMRAIVYNANTSEFIKYRWILSGAFGRIKEIIQTEMGIPPIPF